MEYDPSESMFSPWKVGEVVYYGDAVWRVGEVNLWGATLEPIHK